MNLRHDIYELVQHIPLGYVATYGQIAHLLGLPHHARQVGYALYQVDLDSEIPWHRVVNAQGKISTSPQRHGTDEQQRWRLEAEGIEFDRQGKIDLRRFGWRPAWLQTSEKP